MSEVMQGPGWWLASDGKWYPPELRASTSDDLTSPEGATSPQGEGWWFASDGKWYPPALHPDVLAATPGGASHENAPETRSATRLDEDEASLFRHYVGFVPELGPEPEIRAALREPLPEHALVSSESAGVRSDSIVPLDTANEPPRATEDDLFDIEWGDWDAWEASKPEDVPDQPRGPRHAKGRRWLR